MYDGIPDETINRLVETFIFKGDGERRHLLRNRKGRFVVFSGRDEKEAKIYKVHHDPMDLWEYCKEILEYSTDLNSAFKVVQKLIEVIPQADIHMEHLEGEGWNVSSCYDPQEGEWTNFHNSVSLQRAICYAGLKYFGVDLAQYI